MPSIPVSEMPCLPLDIVLAGSFDSRELVDLLPHAERRRRCARAEQDALRRVHAHCHRDSVLARRIEKQLDFRFTEERELVAGATADGLCARFRGGVTPAQAPPLLWAMLRDPREEMQQLAQVVARRVYRDALVGLVGSGATASPAGGVADA